jgi:hypothetical protein
MLIKHNGEGGSQGIKTVLINLILDAAGAVSSLKPVSKPAISIYSHFVRSSGSVGNPHCVCKNSPERPEQWRGLNVLRTYSKQK